MAKNAAGGITKTSARDTKRASQTSETAIETGLLSVTETGRRLGLQPNRVYERIAQGLIPGVVRLGGRVYVRREILERWLRGDGE